ncbi:MAG: MmcB family DNA repair protein [Paracoccaceae bacterium]|jgi:hypothetical protein
MNNDPHIPQSRPLGTSGLKPGQVLSRGVMRHLRRIGFSVLEEFVPTRGRRVDVMAIGPKQEIWVIECKSGLADYAADHKWHEYLQWCDQFYWAVDTDFPTDVLPADTGLIFADGYGAEIIRAAPNDPLAAARRKKMIHKFAMNAADRLHYLQYKG